MSSIHKTFDTVGTMRRVRDEISSKIKGMTLEEELAWLGSQDLKDPFLERLRRKAAQHDDAADDASRRS